MMLRILAPHFVAGIVRGGQVAPIIRYMKGWTYRRILDYCARKGWSVEVIDDDGRVRVALDSAENRSSSH